MRALFHALLLFHALALSVAVCASEHAAPQLTMSQRRPLLPLRLRGGDHTPLVRAATKICSTPGLVAASGTRAGGLDFSKHVRGIVFGGMDGILTMFALLAAVAGSKHMSASLTLVIGTSTVLADALSMGAGEYLSAKAEEELAPRELDEPSPIEKGVAMFIAFTLFGSLPLLGCVLSTLLSRSTLLPAEAQPVSLLLSAIITGLTLFGLGAIKSQFGAGIWWQAGFEVTGIGGAAASVAYFTAKIVEKLMGEG